MANELFTNGKLRFEQVKGVGTIEVDFQPNQRVYTLIGENGVGKTKFLESLFTLLLLANKQMRQKEGWFYTTKIPFKSSNIVSINEKIDIKDDFRLRKNSEFLLNVENSLPIIYIPAQNRSNIEEQNSNIQKLGNSKERSENYLHRLFSIFNSSYSFKTLSENVNIQEWIIQRAQSANPYQAKEDNREIEIKTLLLLLNKIDQRIDNEFLEISGDNRVFIKIENQKRELSELSSGFTSILKMIQSIIAGYSYFTNEVQIANVRGVVLIDEIESHLHNEWQVKIIPLLKELFPNTTFYITTHSSLVISQLEDGEAYRLQREDDGVVYGKPIPYPNNASFIDLLNEAFNVNLNKLKIDRIEDESQQKAKKALLALVQAELAKGAK
ncbi:AAA family ATPase [Actinobacillus vicugnae]|uniref:AAA family ATPase n=1 Tax=Actinobacillus vicugnae TaxID=2573093 RepID=UPI00123F4E12|nr:AAA family ATPase [Actinobacillus vicugnae]